MSKVQYPVSPPLRILYIEDNPLIVFYLEQLLEELGYVFAGSVDSFSELRERWEALAFDAALVDIDLADGVTGPAAAEWLRERGIPSVFVTGQEQIAAQYSDLAFGTLAKPISVADLAEKLEIVTRVLHPQNRRSGTSPTINRR